jgi:haloalkane dehalogenase
MMTEQVSAAFPFGKKRALILGSRMAYVDVGASEGLATVFLHGNPTSSYLWRNIIPHISRKRRCIAPDLIGFGDSDKIAGSEYRVSDHQRYLDAFLDALLPTEKLTLVIHDWGSVLGLDWARRHEDRIEGLALMEFIPPIDNWDIYPKEVTDMFQSLHEPEMSRELLINQNVFIEKVLPSSAARTLSEEEMNEYRRPFLEVASREPIWRLSREIPTSGEPRDVWQKAQAYIAWLKQTEVSKLLFWATPGFIITEDAAARYTKELKNIRSIHVGHGVHFLQETHPHLIGREIAQWLL